MWEKVYQPTLSLVMLCCHTVRCIKDKINGVGTSSLTLTKAAKYSVSDSLPSFDLITYGKIIPILSKVWSWLLQKALISIITITRAKCLLQLLLTTIKDLCLPQWQQPGRHKPEHRRIVTVCTCMMIWQKCNFKMNYCTDSKQTGPIFLHNLDCVSFLG